MVETWAVTDWPAAAARPAGDVVPDGVVDQVGGQLLDQEGVTVEGHVDGHPSRRSPAASAVASTSSSSVTRTRIACPPLRGFRGMSAACFPGSQVTGDSQVTFLVTVLSPPLLYNRSQGEKQEKDMMYRFGFLRGPR